MLPLRIAGAVREPPLPHLPTNPYKWQSNCTFIERVTGFEPV